MNEITQSTTGHPAVTFCSWSHSIPSIYGSKSSWSYVCVDFN